MVAAGLAGPSRAAVGGVRDFVLGASLLNGRGEWLHFGDQVMKNVAGYDVSRLLAGSMGVLGVITDVSLKVLPRPVATTTLRFDCDEAEALERMNGWAGQPWPIHATAWWNGTLVVRLSGAQAAVRFARDRLGGEPVDAELARAFWQGLRDQTDEYFVSAASSVAQGGRLWRLSVPDTTGPLMLRGDTLLEWGGAQRWLCTDASPEQVRDVAHRHGGHATVYRADSPHGDVFSALSSPLARVHRQLKAAFDPRGIFNPGRLYADL
jgi:glycolate oxidase FAD binding subunit